MTDLRMLGESDWEDEDLLTHEEAGERLRGEIALEEKTLSHASDDVSPATRKLAEARLSAMRRQLERIDAALATGVGRIRKLESPR